MHFVNSSKGHAAYISLDQDIEQATPFPFISSLKWDLLYLCMFSLFSYEIDILLSPSQSFCACVKWERGHENTKLNAWTPSVHSI